MTRAAGGSSELASDGVSERSDATLLWTVLLSDVCLGMALLLMGGLLRTGWSSASAGMWKFSPCRFMRDCGMM